MKDYKKILEGVVNIINTTEKSDIGFANICTYIGESCPELKESESEKIRKVLVELVKCNERSGYFMFNNITTSSMLAWLEKQGEQKSLDDIVKEVTKDKDAAISFLKSTGIINENGELADEYKIEQGEQKSQEEIVDNRHNYLYGEQESSEWSEEDEKMLDEIYEFFDKHKIPSLKHNMDDYVKFIKSIKERVKPQTTWKPSDKQMNALWSATEKYLESDNENVRKLIGEVLESLYEDLKKLREE